MFAGNTSLPNQTTEINGTSPGVQGGLQFDLTNATRFQASVTYQRLLSAEAIFQYHFLNLDRTVSPYLAVGFGRYLGNEGGIEKSVIPAGIGLAYSVSPSLDLNVEVEGRWTINQSVSSVPTQSPQTGVDVVPAIRPSIGLSYKIRTFDRSEVEPGETPVEEEQGGGEVDYDEDQYFTAQRRTEGDDANSPFRDPSTTGGGGGAANFNLPYTRDSLKSSPPLVIERGEQPPYQDPGVAPISGEIVMVTEDGEPTTDPEQGDMVRLPSGTFIMGLTDEDQLDLQNAGRRRITVSGFYIDRFEVTNAEYREWLGTLSSSEREEMMPDSTLWRSTSQSNWRSYFYSESRDDYPVVAITWNEAQAYCESQDQRLPTEAEWEYAARSGRVGGIYPWAGFSVQNARGQYLANFNPDRSGQAADGYAFTAPVDAYPPSRWGLHNVAGNVAEWVQDDYSPTYSNLGSLDPVYLSEEDSLKVIRGGSWKSSAFRIGVGFRGTQMQNEASLATGVRCAANIAQVEGGNSQRGFPQQRQQQTPPQGQQGQGQQGQGQQGQGQQGQGQQGQGQQGQGQQGGGGS
jgi:formylglycine-generating enzyme required for sulfatase activity